MSFDFEKKELPKGQLSIRTPDYYISQPGAIKYAGQYFKEYGKKLLLVGGPTAISKVKDELEKSLEENGLEFSYHEFSGFPSEENINKVIDSAKKESADFIVGIGGGRVLDTVKAAAGKLGIYVGTIPTVAATCAAWAAVTILYDNEGTVVGAVSNRITPRVIIADTKVIVEAPERFLFAGIVDTLAKWYETKPNIKVAPLDITLMQKIDTAEIAYDVLTEELAETIDDISNHRITDRTQRAIDAVIYLAGLVGSLNGVKFYGGIAHSFYNVVTGIPETRKYLHGERVAFGLFFQFVLQEFTKKKVEKELQIFNALKQPITLAQIGVTTETLDQTIAYVAEGVEKSLGFVEFLPKKYDKEGLKKALLATDEWGKDYLARNAK